MEYRLIGLGTQRGSEVIPLAAIAEHHGKRLAKVQRQCGVTNLYRFAKDETLEDVTLQASRQALDNAGMAIDEIDGVYASTSGPTAEFLMPGLARIVGHRLGIKNKPMITLSMGCAGGVQALEKAYHHLIADSTEGRQTSYLVISGDHTSRMLDSQSWGTAPLFSEGAAATVVTNRDDFRDRGYGIRSVKSRSLDGEGLLAMKIVNPASATQLSRGFFQMDGEATAKFATLDVVPALLDLLKLGNSMPENIYLIPHQASGIILEHMIGRHNLDSQRVYTQGIGNIGNMSGASVFFGLEDAENRGLIKPGQEVVLAGFGAELTVAAAHLIQ